MKTKIAIVTDIHSPESKYPQRAGHLAENLLLRIVRRFNNWIKPDVVVICGDIVDGRNQPIAKQCLLKIKEILDSLSCPYIVVRGNHDPSADFFYEVFEKQDWFDFSGCRFVIFDDPEEPNYCARRIDSQMQRYSQARADFVGPIISLQHVPLFPPGQSDCPYRYTNAEKIITQMKENNILLSISGHFHDGVKLINDNGCNFITGAALCEKPFNYTIVEIENGKVSADYDCLAMPQHLGLIDRHVHTELAYCSQNMNVAESMSLYKQIGLAGVVFTEHTSQLYYNTESFWPGDCFIDGLNGTDGRENRMSDYLNLLEKNNIPPKSRGLEIDFDYKNRPMLEDKDKSLATFFLGSIHKLQNLGDDKVFSKKVITEFLDRSEAIVKSGVDVMAHPFRMFFRANAEPDTATIDKVVLLLKKSGMAAEMNFHTQQPPVEFVEKCLNSGIKLCLNSDSHNMKQVGELWPHLQMLESLGVCENDLHKVIY